MIVVDDPPADVEFKPWITEPGIYRGISPEDYHRDPVVGGSLSSTALRKVLPPDGCPAKVRHYLDNRGGYKVTEAMEFGSAAHHLVLGETTKVVKMDVDNWRSPADRKTRDDHRAAGRIVIKAEDWTRVEEMAAAISKDEWASRLLRAGEPEVVVVWRDETTGLMLRAMFDRLSLEGSARVLPFPDYKTTPDASPESMSKSVDRFGYHQQIELYAAGLRAVLPDRQPVGFIVAQETEAPYITSVYQLDSMATRIAQARNRGALDVYHHCLTTGEWPGYVTPPYDLALPRWAEIREGIEA
ncbi:MAG: PD-(D/E)XK nuclease-like domain-containing protein [Actinomycetota bacterium]